MIVDHLLEINRNVRFPLLKLRAKRFVTLLGLSISMVLLGFGGDLTKLSFGQSPSNSDQKVVPAGKSSDQKTENRGPALLALGVVEDLEIVESSGLALARPASEGASATALWTFNDSGGKPVLYRVAFSGATEARLRLTNVKNKDWESMCQFNLDSRSLLAVGDVGDNSLKRKSYKIHVVVEPILKKLEMTAKGPIPLKIDLEKKPTNKATVQKFKSKAGTIRFKYEDGFHNCEAMGFNSEDRSFWLIEKVYLGDRRKSEPGIYVLSDGLDAMYTEEPNEKKDRESGDAKLNAKSKLKNKTELIARRVANLRMRNVTGMAFSNDNQQLVVRSYLSAYLFTKMDGKTWIETVQQSKPKLLMMPIQSQGEAVCFSQDGRSVLLTSEQKSSTIWQVPVDQN